MLAITAAIAALVVLMLSLTVPAKDAPPSTTKQISDASPPTVEAPSVKCEQTPITILAVGDIQLGREIYAEMVARDDYVFPLENTGDKLSDADLAIANLESQIFPWCKVMTKGMRLCAESRSIASLERAGIDVVSVANNHALNFGRNALDNSVRALREAGIAVAGYKRDIPVIERGGVKFAFIAYSPVDRIVSLKRISADIDNAGSKADLAVVLPHWGIEYDTVPSRKQRNLAEYMVAKGADLIIGSHPHVVQPLEYIKETPVAYSLGNFVFDQMGSEDTRRGAAAEFKVCDGSIVSSKLNHSTLVDVGTPIWDE